MKPLSRFAPHLGVAALIIIATLSAGLALTRGKLADVRKDLRVEQYAHRTDIANFKAAQAETNAKHLVQIGEMKDHFWRIKDEADRKLVAVDADWRARVMRIPAAPANPRSAGGAAMPGAGGAASPDGPGGDSVLLARSDALICSTNTARLSAAHDWALGLAGQ